MGSRDINNDVRGGDGRPLFPGLVLLAGLMASLGHPALAQDAGAACASAAARLVSLQGNVELRRAGTESWVPVRRLDTPLCDGDRLRTDALSRAALFVQPETLVRVDQNTAITLKQSSDEIEVEFFAVELAAELRDPLSRGAGYFITRFPKKFRIKTPHMNAAVEGTEFLVESGRDATRLTVLEGEVVAESVATLDRQLVTAGQSVESGRAGPGAITAVIRPLDAVQWVLRYPPISDGGSSTGAEELLRDGSVDEALSAADEALRVDPTDPDALALRAVIQIAKNDKAAALDSAGRATDADDGSFRAWLALSYAQQAGFDLDAALVSARRAQSLEAGSALAHARVAELLLSLGDTRAAKAAARAAVASNPAESHAHSILGFVHLAEIDTKAARNDFQAAIDRDSFSALPRLGLGLAMIRGGELVAGRELIEIAVALDPSNSLLRSYVGKAYFEEATKPRDSLSETQLGLARKLDPNDPTPLLYDALRLQATNRPIDAVASLQESIALNDNRAVYRSRDLLVEDGAVRSVSLARAYQEIGFDKQSLRESSISINSDPSNSSAHRFLADSYLTLPRHEIARRSELLQSQLTQTLNRNPIQPQLTEDNFFVLSAAGPTGVGLNEYTPMFTRNGLTVQADVVGGSLSTWGDQIIVSGLQGRTAFAFSQLAYATDGTRENDDFEKRLYGAFVQYQPATDLSLQADVRHSSSEFGDLLLAFDPEIFTDDRHDLRDLRIRLGMRKEFEPGSHLVFSLAAIDERELVESFGELAIEQDTRTYVGEVQHVLVRDRFNLVTGLGFDTETQEGSFFGQPSEFRPYAANAYAYVNSTPAKSPISAHLGVSIDYLADRGGQTASRTKVNPKVGLTWSPWQGGTLRAATFQTLARQFAVSETIEPTQLAGFNQFYDDLAATRSRRTAFAFDQSLSERLFIGAEWSRRDLTVPLDQSGERYEWDERSAGLHAYWAPSDNIAATAGYSVEEFERPVDFTGKELILSIKTRYVPLTIAVHTSSMFFLRATASYVRQSGDFFIIAAGEDPVPAEDAFWIADLSLGYRLPNRRGSLSVEARNLLDEQYRFQETDLFTSRFARERVILFRASLAY